MRRCGKQEDGIEILHDPHEWTDNGPVPGRRNRQLCDGRTRNAPMVGQVTVAELREALAGEQDGALVAVDYNGALLPLRFLHRPPGRPVYMLGVWTS